MPGVTGGTFLPAVEDRLEFAMTIELDAYNDGYNPRTGYNLFISIFGFEFLINARPPSTPPLFPGVPYTVWLNTIYVTAPDTSTDNDIINGNHVDLSPGFISETFTFNLALSLEVEEIDTVSNLADNGYALPEDIITHACYWKPSAAWSAEITGDGINSLSASIAGTNPATRGAIPFDPYVYINPVTPDFILGSRTNAEVRVTACSVNGIDVEFTSSKTVTHANGNQFSIQGADDGTLTISAAPATGNIAELTCAALVSLVTELEMDGLTTRGHYANYGESVTAEASWLSTDHWGDSPYGVDGRVDISNGVYANTLRFQDRQINVVGEDAVGSGIKPRNLPDSFTISAYTLWALGQDVSLDDLGFLLRDEANWVASTFTHSATDSVGGLGSGWTGVDATVAYTPLTITATADNASASKSTYSEDWRNYRYLRINASCNPARTVRVTLENDKYWDIAVGTSAADYDLDLCNPDGRVGVAPGDLPTTDTTQTSFDPDPGRFYGVKSVTTIKLASLLNSDVLVINGIDLVRKYNVRGMMFDTAIDVHGLFFTIDDWFLLAAGDRRLRHFVGYVDGKQGIDIPCAVRSGGADTPTYLEWWERLSIAEFIAQVNAQTGIACTSPAGELSSTLVGGATNYYNGDLPAAYLTLDADGSRISFERIADAPSLSSIGLRAYPAYNQIAWYYGASVVAGRDRKMSWTKRYQGGATGLVLKDGEPAENENVTISGGDSPTENRLTDSQGQYFSDPHKPTEHLIVETREDSIDDANPWRYWRWGGFFVTQDRGYRCLEVESERGRVLISNGKRVAIYELPGMGFVQESEEHAVDTWRQMRYNRRTGRVNLLGVDGSEWVMFISEDGGQTVTEKVRVTANSGALETDSERGTQIWIYGDGSDNLYRRISQDAGDNWDAAEEVKDETDTQLTGTVLDLTTDYRNGGLLLLALETSGTTRVYCSEDVGATWLVCLS